MSRGETASRRHSLAGPRVALALLALLAVVPLGAQTAAPDRERVERVILPRIRERFYVAVEEQAVTEELIAYIEWSFPTEPSAYPPVVKAYYAALEGLRGRHDTNLLRKYRFVTAAIAMLDPLVEAHPDLLEVRFLRFSFYEQIPGIFGVHHHVPADLAAIIEMLKTGRGTEVPAAVRVDMIDHILETDEPVPEERELLQKLRAQVGRARLRARTAWLAARGGAGAESAMLRSNRLARMAPPRVPTRGASGTA